MNELMQRFRPQILRALRNHKYEAMDDGQVLFPTVGIKMGGVFRHWLNGRDERIESNRVMLAALSDVLQVYFDQQAQRTAFYIGLFANDVDPPNNLTSANFNATLGEFTHYQEAGRVLWNKGNEADQEIDNADNLAIFTGDGTPGTVHGAFVSTTQAKLSNAGLFFCAKQFSAGRDLLTTADKLSIEYDFTAADGSS